MNREIKFRAWDLINKNYVIDLERWCITLSGELIMAESSPPVVIRKCEYSLEQFTGLKDKNGVEIYEGDILSDHIGIGVVKYSERYGAFRISYGYGMAKWFYDYNIKSERDSIEVIGNIHQNPKLIED